jgi:hypothetical protein
MSNMSNVVVIDKIYYTKKDYWPNRNNNLGPGPWIGAIVVAVIIAILIYYIAVGVLWCLIPLGIIVAILGYYLYRRIRYINKMMEGNDEREKKFIDNLNLYTGKLLKFIDKSDRAILIKMGYIK